jgi:predicted ATPase/class 3 adenylate cyclase
VVGPDESSAGGDRFVVITDLVASTPAARALGDGWPAVLARHDALVTAAATATGGAIGTSTGDGFAIVYDDAAAALAGAWAAVEAVAGEPWPEGAPLVLRAGVHAGPVHGGHQRFSGVTVHEAARVTALAGSGRIVLTEPVAAAADELPNGSVLVDLGLHEVRDLPAPVRLSSLVPIGTSPSGMSPRPVHDELIGRSQALATIRSELAPGRLVTIVGPGGIGKTSLVQELVRSHPGDAVVVDLTRVERDDEVDALLLDRFRVEGRAEGLTELIGGRAVLVVLDNCEHVLPGVRAASRAVLACPRATLLAASRRPIGLTVERLHHLGPLAEGAAEHLFRERAAAAIGQERADALPATAIGEVCRRVDGLPLAVVLAAARLRVLAIDDLLARLDDQLGLLVDRRVEDARHRTIAGTIEWSAGQLDDLGRSVFAALAVFRSGAPLDGLEAVLPDVDPFELLDVIDELVAVSLVEVSEHGGAARYRQLEPVRQYAVTLADPVEMALQRDRFAAWVRRRVTLLGRDVMTGSSARRALDVEGPNVSEAVEHLVASSDPEAREHALRIVSTLGYYWFSERPAEGWRLTQRVLAELRGDEPPSAVAGALVTAGQLLQQQWRYADARASLEQAIGLVGERPTHVLGRATFHLGRAEAAMGDRDAARATFDRAEAIFTVVPDPYAMAWTQLWQVELCDDPIAADRRVAELVPRLREQGIAHVLASMLSGYEARRLFLLGDHEGAFAALRESIAINEQLGDTWQLVGAWISAASLSLSHGRPEAVLLADRAAALMATDAGRTYRDHFLGVAAELLRRHGRAELASDLAWSVSDEWRPSYEDFESWIARLRAAAPPPAAPIEEPVAVAVAAIAELAAAAGPIELPGGEW